MVEAGPQLKALAKKVPPQFIGKNHNGMAAMEHTVVTQLLLAKLGAYDFEVREVLRGGTKKNREGNVVTGVVCRLTAQIDGKIVSIDEAGGLENADNPDGDGERLKHATSDALKRCAMRLGLGLHIWADTHYFLDKLLDKGDGETEQPKTTPANKPETSDKTLDTGKRAKIAELVMDVNYDGGVTGFEKKALKGKKIAQLTEAAADKVIEQLEARKAELSEQGEEFDPEEIEGVQRGVPVG